MDIGTVLRGLRESKIDGGIMWEGRRGFYWWVGGFHGMARMPEEAAQAMPETALIHYLGSGYAKRVKSIPFPARVLTPEMLAELRELEKGGLCRCTLADRALEALAALPALLDAAEELERVKRWAKGRCETCAHAKLSSLEEPCKSCSKGHNGDKWESGWNGEATK